MEYEEQVMFKTGGVMTGTLEMGEDQVIKFEGATANAHEITLTVADPSSDTTITLPNTTGTVVTTGDTATVTATMLAANSVDSSELVDGSIDSSHISGSAVTTDKIYADAVTGAKIADNAIDSEHYTDGSIDTAHIAAAQITTVKLADNAVTTVKITDGNITTAKIATDAVTGAKIADDQINSEHYVDGSIDTAHIADSQITTAKIAADAVTNAKIADDQIDSEHYVDGSIDTAHIGDNQVTTAKIADEDITTAKLATDAVTTVKITDLNVTAGKLADQAVVTAKIANDAVTAAKIADAVIVTNSEQASHSSDDSTFFTTSASDARYFNISSGDTIKDGDSFPDNDTTIATTAAINDRIIDLVDDVGGFVPIANETSFPTANPDVNNGAGTLVSIKALASNLVSNGSGVATIANGAGSGNTVTINGLANSTTYAATFGMIVETTSTLHTYAFHRLVPKATEVTTVSGSISNVNTVAGAISNVNTVAGDISNVNAVAADATDIGAVAGKATEIGRLGTAAAVEDLGILGTAAIVEDMSLLGTTACVADMALLGDSAVIADMATIADTSNLITNIGTVAGIQANVTTVAGVSANVTTTANNIANVNNFSNTYQIASSAPSTDGGGNALAAGDLYFDTSSSELKVRNAANNAWQGGVTATGNLIAKGGDEFTGVVGFTDGSTSAPSIYNVGDTNTGIYFGAADEVDVTAGGTTRLEINSDGIDVTGNITLSGNITGTNLSSTGGSNITIAPDGTGDVYLSADTIHVGGAGEDVMISSHGAGDLTLCTAQGSNSGSIEIEDGANNDILITPNGTGDVIIDGLKYPQADGSAGQFLKTDGSAQLSWDTPATVGGATGVDFNDDVKARFGTGNDLEIWHSGDHAFIRNNVTGGMNLQSDNSIWISDGDGTESYIGCVQNGRVELRYDNIKKLETTSDGITTQGQIFISGAEGGDAQLRLYADEGDDNADKFRLISRADYGDLEIQFYDGSSWDKSISCTHAGNVELYYDASKKLETTSAGVEVTGTLEVDGDLWLDNANHAGKDVYWNSSAKQFKLSDEVKGLYGDGGDLEIYHDGTDSFLRNTNGSLTIKNTGNINLYTNNTEDAVVCTANQGVALYYDTAKKLETASGGITATGQLNFSAAADPNISLRDTATVAFGNGDDLKISFDGTHSLIDHTSTSGALYLRSDAIQLQTTDSTPENYVVMNKDGGVELYYDNVKTCETHSVGITVQGGEGSDGVIYLQADEGDDNADKWRMLTAAGSSSWYLQDYNSGSWATTIIANGDGAVELFYDGSRKAYTNSDGLALDSHLIMGDNDEVRLGNGADLKLYHDSGGHGYIDNATGNLNIRTVSGENSIMSMPNAGVKCYYDNNLKIETTAAGGTAYNQWLFTHNCGHSDAIVTITNENSTVTERFFLLFKNSAAGHAGSVRHSGDTSVVYNTSSDYRLKENIQPIANAITQVKQLKPSTFNYKSEPDDTVQGFIAHEVKEVIPKGVAFGEKDGEDMMEMDYARLTPILTAALKEAIAKIETLETKVAALEAG